MQMSKKYLKIELREIHLRIFPNEMCQRAREEKMLTMALGNSLDQKSVKQAYSAIHLPRVFRQYTGKLYYNNAPIPLEIFRQNYPSADSWRVKQRSFLLNHLCFNVNELIEKKGTKKRRANSAKKFVISILRDETC